MSIATSTYTSLISHHLSILLQQSLVVLIVSQSACPQRPYLVFDDYLKESLIALVLFTARSHVSHQSLSWPYILASIFPNLAPQCQLRRGPPNHVILQGPEQPQSVRQSTQISRWAQFRQIWPMLADFAIMDNNCSTNQGGHQPSPPQERSARSRQL